MTREEALFEAKNVLDEATAYEDAVCYVTDDDREWLDMAIKALEQEPCEDCISRKAVEKIINKWLSHPDYELKDSIYDMTKKIHKLPSVTPQSKTGYWIADIDSLGNICYRCSECRQLNRFIDNYCPNCGAKMIDLQESEDMEEIDFIQPKKTVGMLISIDVLDKIKSEIEHEKIQYPPSAGYYKAIMKVLQIIDKYKVESEE